MHRSGYSTRESQWLAAAAPRALGIAVGFAMDRLWADPQRWHPVAGFGSVAAHLEHTFYPQSQNSVVLRRRGIIYTAALVGLPTVLGYSAERAARSFTQPLRFLTEAGLVAAATWTALGGTSLLRIAGRIASVLDTSDDDAARDLLPWLCGRDPEQLSRQEIARAVVESLAENTSDAHVGPLLWAAIAGTPGVVMYRCANTLDAMVGHLSDRYRFFGWAAARFDDLVNYPAARLAGVLTIAVAEIVNGNARSGWVAWRHDAANHPSPNAGVVESTAAGVLNVQLGGRTPYRYGVQHRPLLHAQGRAVAVDDIRRAAYLEKAVQDGAAVSAVVIAAIGAVLRRRRHKRERERRIRRRSED